MDEEKVLNELRKNGFSEKGAKEALESLRRGLRDTLPGTKVDEIREEEIKSKTIVILEDDDNRIETFLEMFPWAKVVKTANECIKLLKKPCDLLFLDHDLGGEIYVDTDHKNTGSEVVRWIEEYRPKIKKIIVHSYNSAASDVMVKVLNRCGYDVARIPFNPNWRVAKNGQ